MKPVEEGKISRIYIENIAQDYLKKAGLIGVFPTDIRKLADSKKLYISPRNLKDIDKRFLSTDLSTLSNILGKVRGIADIQNDRIYLDRSSTIYRIRFTALHEIGHATLPWQRKIFQIQKREIIRDYDSTLSPTCKDEFESEANHFAAFTLFQGEVFQDIINKRSFTVKNIQEVADMFGASFHATARHYMNFSCREGVLLRLRIDHTMNGSISHSVGVWQYFPSVSFTNNHKKLKWVHQKFDQSYSFVRDTLDTSKNFSKGYFSHFGIDWSYEYYNDSYDHFLLISAC